MLNGLRPGRRRMPAQAGVLGSRRDRGLDKTPPVESLLVCVGFPFRNLPKPRRNWLIGGKTPVLPFRWPLVGVWFLRLRSTNKMDFKKIRDEEKQVGGSRFSCLEGVVMMGSFPPSHWGRRLGSENVQGALVCITNGSHTQSCFFV